MRKIIYYILGFGLALYLSAAPALAYTPPPRSSILKLFLRRTKNFSVTKQIQRAFPLPADNYAMAKACAGGNTEQVKVTLTIRNQGEAKNVWLRDQKFSNWGWGACAGANATITGTTWDTSTWFDGDVAGRGPYFYNGQAINIPRNSTVILSYIIANHNAKIPQDVLYSAPVEVSSDYWAGNENGPFYSADVGYVLQPGEGDPMTNPFQNDLLSSAIAEVSFSGAAQPWVLGDVGYALKAGGLAGQQSPAQLVSASVEVALEDDPTKYYVADTAYALLVSKISFQGGIFGKVGIKGGLTPGAGSSTGTTGGQVGSPVLEPFPRYQIDPNSTAFWDPNSIDPNSFMKINIDNLVALAQARILPGDKINPGPNWLNTIGSDTRSDVGVWDPAGGIWKKENGDLTLGTAGQSTVRFQDEGTIIVTSGNLYINVNIAAEGPEKKRVGFIVLEGKVIVDPDVTKIEAAFFVPKGTIDLGSGTAKPLTVTGSLVAKNLILKAREVPLGQYAVTVLYDPVLSQNPPPGFARILAPTLQEAP